MNIEKRLTERIGAAGGRLHTGRSRNDQVALDTHLYLKEEIKHTADLLLDLQEAILELADKHTATIMPGYTHLQRAQPITFAHHIMAYFFMLQRDIERLQLCFTHTDMMPLGAGALAGTTFPIDRHYVAEQLGFASLYENSIDAVSDRDYILEFMAFAAVLMMHLSRLSEELILWSSTEFNFIELDDAFCTGSSIMPQKKNPDVAELVRGKTGRIYGHLIAMLTAAKGLPLAYNKDLQEDKEGLFDTVDTIKVSVAIYGAMLRNVKVNQEVMLNALRRDFSNATDMADYLVKKGLPFRQAHEVVGKTVLYCTENNLVLTDLTLAQFKKFSVLFEEDILAALSIEACVEARRSYGGTAPAMVAQAIRRGKELVAGSRKSWLDK
jgi:argininosuccinate lyase